MNQFNAHLTENYQLKAADELISKLRQELGMEKSYNDELEEELKETKKKVKELELSLDKQKEEVKKVKDRYSADVQHAVKLDAVYAKQQATIKKLEEDLKRAMASRDVAISELIKLRG